MNCGIVPSVGSTIGAEVEVGDDVVGKGDVAMVVGVIAGNEVKVVLDGGSKGIVVVDTVIPLVGLAYGDAVGLDNGDWVASDSGDDVRIVVGLLDGNMKRVGVAVRK